MNDWVQKELERLKSIWPELEYEPEGNWVLLKQFPIPSGWNKRTEDIAFRIPAGLPGEEPYAFWVKGGLQLVSGTNAADYAHPAETIPFSKDNNWGRFSWRFNGWAPGSQPGEGTGMVHFVYSFSKRLREL